MAKTTENLRPPFRFHMCPSASKRGFWRAKSDKIDKRGAIQRLCSHYYQIGFCSISKDARVQCEQELIFCCVAEILPKRSQCEHKPFPSDNLHRSILIRLPIRGSVAISAPIEVFILDSDRFKNISDTKSSAFNSRAEQYCSGAETASKAVQTKALSGTL